MFEGANGSILQRNLNQCKIDDNLTFIVYVCDFVVMAILAELFVGLK